MSKNLNLEEVTIDVRNITRNAAHTCNLPLAHLPPQLLGLAHGPVLHLRAEGPEELVLLEVGHAPFHLARCVSRRRRRSFRSRRRRRHLCFPVSQASCNFLLVTICISHFINLTFVFLIILSPRLFT